MLVPLADAPRADKSREDGYGIRVVYGGWAIGESDNDLLWIVVNKFLDTPGIAWCMQDLDERSALTGNSNLFDGCSMLQIIDKCRANNWSQHAWAMQGMQGIWHRWRRGNIEALNGSDIKGLRADRK